MSVTTTEPALTDRGADRPPSWVAVAAVAAVLTAVLLGLTVHAGFPDDGEDSAEYRTLAQGRWAEGHQPFSARFLHPLLVHGLSRLTHASVDRTFAGVALLAVPLFVVALAVLVRRLRVPPVLLVPALTCASLVQTIRLDAMPDLFYSLLLAVFLLLLAADQLVWAAVGLVLLFCARESTVVLGVTAVAVAVVTLPKPRNRRAAALFLLATVVGAVLNRAVSNLSGSNVHHISGLTYMLGKVPYNFTKNVLGVQVWTNTLVQTQGDHPLVRLALPRQLRAGGITDVGISEVTAFFPLHWLLSTACTFGVLLTVLLREAHAAWRDTTPGPRSRRLGQTVARLAAGQPFVVRLAGAYGVVSLLIVPLLGTATHRYVYYAWPAFLLLALVLFARDAVPRMSGPALLALLTVHLALCWLPAVPTPGVGLVTAAVVGLAVAVVLHAIAWRVLGGGPRGLGSTAAA